MWLVVSLGFKAYVDNFGDYNKVYGSIAGVIVLMLWFYWSGMVLLLGGEINAEIEQRRRGKAEGRTDGEDVERRQRLMALRGSTRLEKFHIDELNATFLDHEGRCVCRASSGKVPSVLGWSISRWDCTPPRSGTVLTSRCSTVAR